MGRPIPPTQLDWTAGASLMIRREVIDAVGGFDETFSTLRRLNFATVPPALAGARTSCRKARWPMWIRLDRDKDWQRTPQYWFDSRLHYFLSTHGRAYTVGATLALISGSLLYGLRRLVSDKPASDYPIFCGI
ncbi:hypothetical protein ACM258_00015 [Phaeobacter piscinae]|uniref:hypothetical protein n=1 Tax=Phaeobacter piscinae TaxID=1580596 RepID=UPI0039F6E015